MKIIYIFRGIFTFLYLFRGILCHFFAIFAT